MPGEDRCQHGMIRTQCAICQAPPEYEMKESTFKGYPIVELLYRGGPIHERDSHFRFGKKKAMLLLACIKIVEELAATQPGELPNIRDQIVRDRVNGMNISVKVESFTDFELPPDIRINAPWVRLQWESNPDLHIGFGRRKAKAILALKRKLAEWAGYPLNI